MCVGILVVPPASFTSAKKELHTVMFSKMVLSVFLFLREKCLHVLVLPISLLVTLNRFVFFTRRQFRVRDFCPLSVFRYTASPSSE